MVHSIDKPPLFNGEHYAYWKNRMMFFIKAKDFHLWDIVEDGPFVPTTSRSEWSANDRKKMELNCKALHILFCALGPDEYGKETKIGLLNLEYENFKMDPNEDIKSMFDRGKGRNIELEEVQQQQVIEPEVEGISQAVEENPTDLETQPLRRSTRERHEPERYGFLVTTHGDVILVDQDEPKTYQEAVASPDSEKWLEAMRSEMDSMSENQVWTLVEPPEGIKPIGCKWVFKKKTDMDGNVQTYKGRLVAKGFQQIHGVDYDETFSPVAMIKSIRILLAVVAFHDYVIWQMDVKTAFLNGKLEEGVYMTQPEGFVTPENAGKVCKLQRSIYGLKQASRSWNLRFNEAIQEFGFIRNEDEPCVYKKFSGSIVSFLILYVNDILIIGNDILVGVSPKTSHEMIVIV
ncbi:hypothetical protein V6N12_012623 [Hibiscus sabdariffa]|uniref:Reverse transcriptase Ty1/copia-type domain-containing protein n=1 Tax=Hibiscus sabdariffa TaxID=183260 RepID=A0ABR2DD19_9ROSI